MKRQMFWIVVIACLAGCSLLNRLLGKEDANPVATIVPDNAVRACAYGPIARPAGYNAGIAWINAVQRTTRSTNGSVTVRSMELWGWRSDGTRQLLALDDYRMDTHAGGIFTRDPWFGGTVSITSDCNFFRDRHGLGIPTGKRPDCVFHLWGRAWPRTSLPPDVTELVVVVVLQCFGDACAQVGADFWPDPATITDTNPPPMVVEAGASRWVGAADALVTITLGQ